MIIGIDANEANLTRRRVGINQFAFYLLQALHQLQTSHSFVIYLKSPPLEDLPPPRSGWQYRMIPFPKLWTQTRLPWDLYVHRPRPDVFFSLTHYAPRFAPMPTVVSIMDLGFLQTPGQFTARDFNQLKSWTAYSVRQASKIIAISEFTQKEIVRVYGRSPADVVVAYPAYDHQLFKPVADPAVLKKYGIRPPYLLFLSSLKPSKNVEGLIRAFHQLSTPNYQLVIAGKKAWLYDQIFALVRQLGLTGRVIFTGFVEETEVPALMTQASAFILPSFHEGFGIPVLEAMACGTPVVISNIAALPEVAGNAAIYIDPHSRDSLVQGIQTAIGPARAQFVKRGLERVKLLSWSKTAGTVLTVLESAV